MASISKEDLITWLGIDQPATADMITDEMQSVVLEHRDLYLSKKCFAIVVNAYFSVL